MDFYFAFPVIYIIFVLVKLPLLVKSKMDDEYRSQKGKTDVYGYRLK